MLYICRMTRPLHHVTSLALAAALGLALLSCGDEPTKPSLGPTSDEAAAAGAPASIQMTVQPPAAALDREVWDPSRQPTVTVKDAAGAAVGGVVVTASVGSGSGALQGAVTATTDASGVARFGDLGIAGTGAHRLRYATGAASALSATFTLSALPAEAARGKWDAPASWDIVPLHLTLLPTGKLLAWGRYESGTTAMGNPRLWDPTAGAPTTARSRSQRPDMLFCSGHALMADGGADGVRRPLRRRPRPPRDQHL